MGIHCAFIITLLLTLSACLPSDAKFVGWPAVRITGTPEPVQCDDFAESYWKEFRFGIDSIEDVVATVSRLWEYDGTRSKFNYVCNVHCLMALLALTLSIHTHVITEQH